MLALPISRVLLDSVKASWAKPASVPVSSKKLDHMYRTQETSAEFLFTHPKLILWWSVLHPDPEGSTLCLPIGKVKRWTLMADSCTP